MDNSVDNSNKIPSDGFQKLFKSISTFVYIIGQPEVYNNVDELPAIVVHLHTVTSKIIYFVIILFIIFEWVAHYTQSDLTETQVSDLVVFSFSHPIMFCCSLSIEYYKSKIKDVLLNLRIQYMNVELEKAMIRRCKFFCVFFIVGVAAALTTHGFNSAKETIYSNGTFTTIITFWPDVKDRSIIAQLTRVLYYLIWWLFMARCVSNYILVISTIICCSHQFKQLQCYFNSIEEIFDRDFLTQEKKETLYVEALRHGIKMHVHIIRYTRQCHLIGNTVCGGQIIVNIIVIMLLMSKFMHSERALVNVLPIITTGCTLLVTTGYFMCTAGDITVEGSKIAVAMYSTGWEKCYFRSIQVRQLLNIALIQAQKPVVLNTLGIVPLSYQGYLSIVKSSYTLFSVLY